MYNPYLVIGFVSWVIAQAAKFVVQASGGRIDYRLFYASGGMPSAHSAVVTAVAATALLVEGFASPIFGLAAVLAGVVMYDSFGVRRAAGEQAAALNSIIESLRDRGVPAHRLREVLGHKPLEVIAGSLIGALVAALFNGEKLETQADFLVSSPVRMELLGYAILFALLVLGGWLASIWLRRKHKGSAAVKSFTKALLIKTQVLGWIGLLFAFSAWQDAQYLSWRIWPVMIIIALIIWDIVLAKTYWSSVPRAMEEERERARKQKWLDAQTKGKKKRR